MNREAFIEDVRDNLEGAKKHDGADDWLIENRHRVARMLTNPPPWEDRPDDLTEAVTASHPVHSKDWDSYSKALELVSNRHSKGALVALVCHLLHEAKP